LCGILSPVTGGHRSLHKLVSHGRRACTLDGYPQIRLYAHGVALPLRYSCGGGTYVTRAAPGLLTLRPGGAATSARPCAPLRGPKSCIRCADAAAAVISCGRMLLGRLTGDTATFREISAKHWHRPALVFNGREEDTFETKFAQLSERTAGRTHPGDRRPLVLRLATGRQSREALAAPGAIRNNEHSG
jgi:hypothetical protein